MRKSVCMYIMLLAVVLLASCSDEKRYVNVLPEEPGALFALDVKQLVQKSGLSAEDTKTVVDEIKGAWGEGLDAQGTELMDKVLADPDESGLDLSRKIYLFTDTGLKKSGLLACVKDKAKLDRLAGLLETQQLTRQVEDKGFYRQAVVQKGILAYSECSCLLLFSETDADLQGWASLLMEQEEKGTFSRTEAFRNMEKIKGEIAAYASMELLPEEFRTMMKASAPFAFDWKEIDVVAGMCFEKGRMVLDVETVLSEAVKKEYEKIRPIYSKETSDRFLKLFPEDSFLWLDMGMKGDKLYEMLEKEPTLTSQLKGVQALFDLKSLLNAVDGETVFCISSLKPVSFAVLAEVTDAGFLKSFESLKPMLGMTGGQMKLVEAGTDAYELQIADGRMAGMSPGAASIYIGVKDGVFYLTNEKQCAGQEEVENSMKKASWAGNVPGKRCFMAMNWSALDDMLQGESRRMYDPKDRIARKVLDVMDYITMETKDDTHGRMEIGMKDKETNALKQLIEMGRQLSLQ